MATVTSIKIKICGLSTVEHALAAAAAGADFIGLVFAPSRRHVTSDQAATIAAALRQHPAGTHVGIVGLFVNEQPDQINTVADDSGLDYVQLSGDETPQQAAGIHRPVLKALRLTGDASEAAWLHALPAPRTRERSAMEYAIDTGCGTLNLAPCPWVIDAHVAGSYGGSGVLANWEHAAELARQYPAMLAGGLSPANVAAAVQQVRPWGVDVSSGVETDRVKDTALIEQFIQAARAAT
jgi:phosphoribosylanthranilate isomerase